jgi:hypothetical protein
MTLPTTLPTILEALRNAGATEEMLAAVVKAAGESRRARPSENGRAAHRVGALLFQHQGRDQLRHLTKTIPI